MGLLFEERQGPLILSWDHVGPKSSVHDGDDKSRTSRKKGSGALDFVSKLPLPCCKELWESRDLDRWEELARSAIETERQQQIPVLQQHGGISTNPVNTLAQARDAIPFGSNLVSAIPLDLFQSSILLTYNFLAARSVLNRPQGSALTAASVDSSLTKNTIFCQRLLQLVEGPQSQAPAQDQDRVPSPPQQILSFTISLYTATQYAPVRDLLLVAGNSWIFGRKAENEEDFLAAKKRLDLWLRSGEVITAVSAAWDAMRMRLGKEDDTCADMNLLHGYWALYVLGVICWAFTMKDQLITTALDKADEEDSMNDDGETRSSTEPEPRRQQRHQQQHQQEGHQNSTTAITTSMRKIDLILVLGRLQKKLTSKPATPCATDVADPVAATAAFGIRDKMVLGGLLDEAAGVLSRLIGSLE